MPRVTINYLTYVSYLKAQHNPKDLISSTSLCSLICNSQTENFNNKKEMSVILFANLVTMKLAPPLSPHQKNRNMFAHLNFQVIKLHKIIKTEYVAMF